MMLRSKRIPRISGWMMWRLLRPISLAMPRSCCCCWWEKRSSRPTKKEKWGWWPLLLLISKDRHHMKASIPNNPGSIMSSNDVGSQTPYFWPHVVWKLLKMSHLNFWILAFSTNFCVLLKLTCLVTLFDRKLYVFKNLPNWAFLVF